MALLTLIQAKKVISYAESDEDEDDAFDPAGVNMQKRKQRKPVVEDDDDEGDVFIGGLDGADDDGMVVIPFTFEHWLTTYR